MSEKKNKYDTDPLDPEFARRAEEDIGGDAAATEHLPRGATTTEVAGERPTEHVRPSAGEEATRMLDDAPRRVVETPRNLGDATRRLEDYTSPYPSVFVPPPYQPPAQGYNPYAGAPHHAGTQAPPRVPYASQQGKPTQRHVAGLGLPENLAMVLPYAPAYIGLVAALVELLLVPRHEHRVRFHAAQGLALQLAIVAISVLFWLIRMATGSGFGRTLFGIAATVFLIVSMIRVWKGEPHRVAPLDDLTAKLNQNFEPKKR
ncbi:MAG TPA: DUF4870 domain-containing protein [Pyrinomonadaceae bacterium]|nr:DUF4870 domain-containing protein [Pyrinomonadaceae bacterium]